MSSDFLKKVKFPEIFRRAYFRRKIPVSPFPFILLSQKPQKKTAPCFPEETSLPERTAQHPPAGKTTMPVIPPAVY